MIDLLFLTFNRLEYTRESWACLLENTNWKMVSRLIIYDDTSTDGTLSFVQEQIIAKDWSHKPQVLLRIKLLRNPVKVMQDYMAGTDIAAKIFAKIDSDTVVPPLWLDQCHEVMEKYPQLSLLGIEPPMSRRRFQDTTKEEMRDGPLRYVPCDSIGGIGLMRRTCFGTAPMNANGTYGGFTEWQVVNGRNLVRGWMAPSLKVFLLDRMPIEPWSTLSKTYIANGWQRPWDNYTMNKEFLWDWWTPTKQKLLAEAEPIWKQPTIVYG